MSKSMKFDSTESLALQALGFEIGPDSSCGDDHGMSCAVIRRSGDDGTELSVMIMRAEDRGDFTVSIALPNGGDLSCFTSRGSILQAVERAAFEGKNGAAKWAFAKLHGVT
jgi:hypothetical protein